MSTQSADQYNRRLEKSIGQYDITHNYKLGLIYELPFGFGKPYLSRGVAAHILGNWRISTVNTYSSGIPVAITTTVNPPLFAYEIRSPAGHAAQLGTRAVTAGRSHARAACGHRQTSGGSRGRPAKGQLIAARS